MGHKVEITAVELPQLFRLINRDKIPQQVIARGYDPEVSRQVAVFGDHNSLIEWRKQHELSERDFPIHPSKLGIHIDIYEPDLHRLESELKLSDFMEFGKSKLREAREKGDYPNR